MTTKEKYYQINIGIYSVRFKFLITLFGTSIFAPLAALNNGLFLLENEMRTVFKYILISPERLLGFRVEPCSSLELTFVGRYPQRRSNSENALYMRS